MSGAHAGHSHDLSLDRLAAIADALQAGMRVEIRFCDELQGRVFVSPDPSQPFEVDFLAAVSPRDLELAQAWAEKNIPEICKVWSMRYGARRGEYKS